MSVALSLAPVAQWAQLRTSTTRRALLGVFYGNFFTKAIVNTDVAVPRTLTVSLCYSKRVGIAETLLIPVIHLGLATFRAPDLRSLL